MVSKTPHNDDITYYKRNIRSCGDTFFLHGILCINENIGTSVTTIHSLYLQPLNDIKKNYFS